MPDHAVSQAATLLPAKVAWVQRRHPRLLLLLRLLLLRRPRPRRHRRLDRVPGGVLREGRRARHGQRPPLLLMELVLLRGRAGSRKGEQRSGGESVQQRAKECRAICRLSGAGGRETENPQRPRPTCHTALDSGQAPATPGEGAGVRPAEAGARAALPPAPAAPAAAGRATVGAGERCAAAADERCAASRSGPAAAACLPDPAAGPPNPMGIWYQVSVGRCLGVVQAEAPAPARGGHQPVGYAVLRCSCEARLTRHCRTRARRQGSSTGGPGRSATLSRALPTCGALIRRRERATLRAGGAPLSCGTALLSRQHRPCRAAHGRKVCGRGRGRGQGSGRVRARC